MNWPQGFAPKSGTDALSSGVARVLVYNKGDLDTCPCLASEAQWGFSLEPIATYRPNPPRRASARVN